MQMIEAEKEPLQDHCGIVAAYCEGGVEFTVTGIAGLIRIQTRGYDGAGVVCFADDEVRSHKNKGMIASVFSEEVVRKFKEIKAKMWLFQTRYGTRGNGDLENIQPIVRRTVDGEVIAVIHNGQFVDEKMPGCQSDTVLFTNELAALTGTSWDERILWMQERQRGAWSLAVATPAGLYLMRDGFGVRPLFWGRKTAVDGGSIWLAASETAAMEAMGVREMVEVEPGMVMRIDREGAVMVKEPDRESKKAACIFENVYLSNGGSLIHRSRKDGLIDRKITVGDFRVACGKYLAFEEEEGFANRVDLAIGIPGTGITGGRSYALALGIPYIQAISDRRPAVHDMRTFMTPVIAEIPEKIKDHFWFDRNFLVGMRVVLIDDSIVRGNISRGLNRILKEEYGVREVHVRVLCPPIDKPCHLGINTRVSWELIAAGLQGDIGKIGQEIGANSLRYLSDKFLIEAAGGGEEFCLGCMIGHHPPIDHKGQIIYERK